MKTLYCIAVLILMTACSLNDYTTDGILAKQNTVKSNSFTTPSAALNFIAFPESGTPSPGTTFQTPGVLFNGQWNIDLPIIEAGTILPDMTIWVTDVPGGSNAITIKMDLVWFSGTAAGVIGAARSDGTGNRQQLTIPGGFVVAPGQTFKAIFTTRQSGVATEQLVSIEPIHIP